MALPYQIFDSSGAKVLDSDTRCRYPRHIELSMLDAGYTIKLDGKRLTKAEIRRGLSVNVPQ